MTPLVYVFILANKIHSSTGFARSILCSMGISIELALSRMLRSINPRRELEKKINPEKADLVSHYRHPRNADILFFKDSPYLLKMRKIPHQNKNEKLKLEILATLEESKHPRTYS